jgi:lysophospholipid acyltransferase
MNIVGFFYRLKYYVGWYIAQGATNLSGLSLDANGNYTTVTAVNLKFETELNARTKTEYWNSSMQLWLKEVVYDEMKGFGEQFAFLGTFLLSAYWHGLYLTYYVGSHQTI